MKALVELLQASTAILPSVRTGQNDERIDARERFIAAIESAEVAIEALAGPRILRVIEKADLMGWRVSEFESLNALAAVLEFPGRKIAAIKAFRTRTDDGGSEIAWRIAGNTAAEVNINRLKRAKEIIEVAQEVLQYGV